MLDKNNYIVDDIADIFKGYSTTKLKENIESIINNKDKTNTNFQDFITSEEVKVLGWKQIKEYVKNHKIDDNCNIISVNRRYNKDIKHMQKGDIVLSVLPSKDSFEILYIEEEPEENCIYNESVFVIRVTESSIDSKYVYIMCTTKAVQDKILQLPEKEKRVMLRITKEALSSIKIAKLTESERKQIVDDYTKLHNSINDFNNKINNIQNNI